MPLFAHLTKIALNDKTHNMNDDVSFIEFNGTIDLFKKIHDIFGDQMVDVLNCHYDDKYLIQGFYIYSEEGQHDDFVLVKRLLNDNDQYVYTAELELRQNDEFIHENITFDDINNIFTERYKHNGLLVRADGTINDVISEILPGNTEHEGILRFTNLETSEIFTKTFLNVISLSVEHDQSKNTEPFENILQEYTHKINPDYLFSKSSFDMGALLVFGQTDKSITDTTTNQIGSKIMSHPIPGDVLVGLESTERNDEKILKLDKNIFSKILDIIGVEGSARKNKTFCNIYYELC